MYIDSQFPLKLQFPTGFPDSYFLYLNITARLAFSVQGVKRFFFFNSELLALRPLLAYCASLG
jgi:hypothetical protein